MKRSVLFTLTFALIIVLYGGEVRKTYVFKNHIIKNQGIWQTITLDNTLQTGKQGEPILPFCPVSLLLPPGEKAISIKIEGEDPVLIPGQFMLYPKQDVQPLSQEPNGHFIKNEIIYRNDGPYPTTAYSHLTTAWLNGYAFALSTFTPVVYNPVKQSLFYYSKVTVIIQTKDDQDSKNALKNLTGSAEALKRVRIFSQNSELMDQYPQPNSKSSVYQVLILTSQQFESGFHELIDFYYTKGIIAQVTTLEETVINMPGQDLQEKIRNYIIQEYQNNGIEHVLLGGDVEHIPYRGFYCFVISSPNQEDYNIPADLYYSALDGNWNIDGDNRWGEPGEDDLLPDVSVARMPFSTAVEQENMVHKSVFYQNTPVTGELTKPLFVGEHLFSDPMTFGQDYIELLVDDRNDNGYFTHGIPHEVNTITRLYDTLVSLPDNIFRWTTETLINEINRGHSFIHHNGHANVNNVMRLVSSDITNENFLQVNGSTHNYTLLYSEGCLCGAFDYSDCIAEKMVTIDNFLVATIVNSRFGWFDQGLTEGPSAHLHREFVSAMYNDTVSNQILEIGVAHMMSKIKTAPWVTASNEFEPGAQRWCHYGCNVLGDPALRVWIKEPNLAIPDHSGTSVLALTPNPAKSYVTLTWNCERPSVSFISLINTAGQTVRTIRHQTTLTGKQTATVDLSGLIQGIYCIRLDSENRVIAKRLVKTD